MDTLENGTQKPKGARARDYTVDAIIRAMEVLKAFPFRFSTLELHEIAEKTQQNKSTAFRVAETLVQGGVLERVGRAGYRLQIDMTPTKRYTIGWTAASAVRPFAVAITEGLVAASSELGVNLVTLDNALDPATSLQNADRLVQMKVDLAIGADFHSAMIAQLSAKYASAQIPFITINLPHPGAFYFGIDNYRAGRTGGRYLARWVAAHWSELPNQIFLVGIDSAGPYLNTRLQGLYDGMIEVLPELRTANCGHIDSQAKAEKTFDLLRRRIRVGNLRRVIVGCVDDSSAIAALQAFRDFGMEDRCVIAGQGGSPEVRDELRKESTGLVCSVAYFPETYGRGLVRFAGDILNHRRVPPAIFIQHQIITQQNVSKVYPNDGWLKSPERWKSAPPMAELQGRGTGGRLYGP